MAIPVIKTSRRSLLGWLLTASFGVVAAGSSALAQPNSATTVKLDYAYYNPVSLVLKEKGILEQELKKKNIKVEWVLSQGSNKALEFLNARSLDIGSTAGAAALIGKANGNPIKAIYVYSKSEWTAIVVGKDSKLQSVKDLKGKRVAANRGTDPYIFLLRSLYKNGINPRSVEIVQLAHADGKAALEKGDVDAWAGLDPLMAKSELESKSRLLYRNQAFNSYGVLNVREEFAKQNPETVLAVLRAYEKARLWALRNPEGLKQVVIKEAKLSDAVASRQLERTDLSNSNIGTTQKVVILAAADVLRKASVIPADTDIQVVVNGLIDPSFINRLNKPAK